MNAATACADVTISEFMAVNRTTLQDEDGTYSDWIEIYNSGPGTVDLDGWYLTDDQTLLTKWRFPSTNAAVGARLVVFASGKDRAASGSELHTSFLLDGDGEFLALVKPDATTIATQFAPYPEQVADVSYGYGVGPGTFPETLVADDAVGKSLIPSGPVAPAWRGGSVFDDSGWRLIQLGLGFGGEDHGEPIVAYAITAGTAGNQSFGGALGMDFIVNEPVVVTELGVFDDGSDGLGRTITAELWSRNDGGTVPDGADDSGVSILVSEVFTPGDSGVLQGGSRFKPLAAPLTLRPGAYTIVAHGYGSGELNGNADHFNVLNDGGGMLGFIRSRWGNTPGGFPGNPQDPADRFGAGTLTFAPADDPRIRTDLEAAMRGVNASVLLRVPFVINDVNALYSVSLEIAYDDGFDAYLNGTRVASRNAPGMPTWSSTATSATNTAQIVDLSAYIGELHTGTNILAVQGMNIDFSDGDFLLAPKLSARRNLQARLYFFYPSPGTANGTGSYGTGVIINEIHYDPESGALPPEFVELFNAGAHSLDLSGWRLSGGLDYTFPAGTALAKGDYLVVSFNTNSFAARFPGVPVMGPFSNQLGNAGDDVDLRNASDALMDRVAYGVGAPWPVAGIALDYHSLQLLHPGLDNDLAGSWRATNPTPGAANEVLSDSPPPQIRRVAHDPQVPTSGVPVTISCKVTDPEGVASVKLEYQVIDPGNYIRKEDAAYASGWTLVAMTATSGSVYTAVLPGTLQAHRRLVRYRILAEDTGGAGVRLPLPSDPSLNFAYFTYDGVPSWSGADEPGVTPTNTFSSEFLESIPVYHLIADASDVANCQYNNAYRQVHFSGTMVYDGEVYDHIRFNIRGEYSTYVTGKNKWRFRFNRGRYFQARDNYGRKFASRWKDLKVNAGAAPWTPPNRGMAGVEECISFRLFELAGVPSSRTGYFHFRVVDDSVETNPSDQYDGDLWGLYYSVEVPDTRFLDDRNLPDGNLYKLENPFIQDNQGVYEPVGPTDLQTVRGLMSTTRSERWWRDTVDHVTYGRYKGVAEAITHYDQRDGLQGCYYHNPEVDKWQVLPWDLDTMFQLTSKYYTWDRIRLCIDPSYPNLRLEAINEQREVLDLLFNAKAVDTAMGEFVDIVNPAGQPLTWADLDQFMWNYHPRTQSKGSFNLLVASGNPAGHWYSRTLISADHEGQMDYMRKFMQPGGYGYDNLVAEVADADIPGTPTIQYTGPTGHPLNQLSFACSAFSDPQGVGTFGAMQWRIGEVLDTMVPAYDPTRAAPYEVTAKWESAELVAYTNGITIPFTGLEVGHAYRVRVRMKDDTERWSHWSPPVEFVAGEASNAQALKDHLRVTEIMFNAPMGSDFDFIEIHNTSDLLSLDLEGVSIAWGIAYTFAAGVTLPTNGHLVVAKLPGAAFDAYYGTAGVTVLGPYSQDLSNGGEKITIESPGGGDTVVVLRYGDGRGWPLAADGPGHSLVPIDEALALMDQPAHWRASSVIGGSPGAPDPDPVLSVQINEIAAHTDTGLPAPYDSDDWIEIYNPLGVPVDIGGWWLSDRADNLMVYALPTGTVVEARGYHLLTEVLDFHTNRVNGSGFGLDKAGEQVFLSRLSGNGTDRIVDAIRFKGQENGMTLGRYHDGDPYWRALMPTPGTSNTAPARHVVISRIMYHPAPTAANPEDNTNDEFIEILNPTPIAVALWTAAGAWRLDGEIAFTFPSNTVLAAGERVRVVSFDPLIHTQTRDAFLVAHALTHDESILVGPYSGRLGNRGGRVGLEKPQLPDLPEVDLSWVIVDEVIYSPAGPWPVGTDGTGIPLTRLDFDGAGSDPANWRAGIAGLLDLDRDGLPDDWENHYLGGTNATPQGHADSDGVSNRDEYIAGTDPADAASVFSLDVEWVDSLPVVRFDALRADGDGYDGFERYYDLTRSSNLLNDPWMPLPGLSGVLGRNQVIAHTNTTGRVLFYRAEAWLRVP